MNKLLIHVNEEMPDERVEELKLLVRENLKIDCEVKKDYVTKGIEETIATIILSLIIKDVYDYLKPKFAKFLKNIFNRFTPAKVIIKDNQSKSIYIIPSSIEESELEKALEKIPSPKKKGYFFYDINRKEWKND